MIFLISTFVVFALAMINKLNSASFFELVIGVAFEGFILFGVISYITRDRDNYALIIYEKGLWHFRPPPNGRFFPWSDIESVNHGNRFLVIIPKDRDKYWRESSLLTKALFFPERLFYGSHLLLAVGYVMDIDFDDLLSLVRSRLEHSKLEQYFQ